MKASSFLGIGLLFLLAAPASAESPPEGVVERTAHAEIRWTEGTVRAWQRVPLPAGADAEASIRAERVATVMARRNLLEAVKGVRVESTTTVENFMGLSDRVRVTVEGLLRGSRVVEQRDLGQGGVQVVVEIPLKGELTRSLLEEMLPASAPSIPGHPMERLRKGGRIEPTGPEPSWAGLLRAFRGFAGWFFEGIGPSSAWAVPQPTGATGLVVDASDLPIRPALFPRLFDERGVLLLGPGTVDPQKALLLGAVGYAPSVSAALHETSRLGLHPLVARGIVPLGSQSGIDVALKDMDLQRLQSVLRNPELLRDCGVSVVYKITF